MFLSLPEPAALAGELVRKVCDSLQLLKKVDMGRGKKQERGSHIKAETAEIAQ